MPFPNYVYKPIYFFRTFDKTGLNFRQIFFLREEKKRKRQIKHLSGNSL